jgi:hypothetical protein
VESAVTLEDGDLNLQTHTMPMRTNHALIAEIETVIVDAPPTWLRALRMPCKEDLLSTEAHSSENLGA